MPRVCIIADDGEELPDLTAALAREDFDCSVVASVEGIEELAPDLVLLDADTHAGAYALYEIAARNRHVPTVLLGRLDRICSLNSRVRSDDFLVKPYDPRELVLRVKRLVRGKTGIDPTELIARGELAIDTGRCEVTVSGRPVVLTFREYELLRFLASNPGHVFTRDALLDRVWGDDYFGSDRTVDVHIRRLRSKIEAFGHCFIETVRSVGYRFTHTVQHQRTEAQETIDHSPVPDWSPRDTSGVQGSLPQGSRAIPNRGEGGGQ